MRPIVMVEKKRFTARGEPYVVYNFEAMQHGDAIRVRNKDSAQEMLRRWNRVNGRSARLISSTEHPGVLFFIDQDPVRKPKPLGGPR